MNITTINYTRACPYISRANIADQFDISLSSVDKRIKEIKQEIEKGRYSTNSVIKDGGIVLVNYLVFIDYEINRQKLLDSNARKYAEPYKPSKIAREIGWYN